MTDKKTTTEETAAAQAARSLLNRLAALNLYTGEAERDPDLAATGATDAELADAVALLQDVRHRLGLVERDLTVALGQRMGKGTGSLSDGRMFTLARAADRKEWDHEDWKRDARRAIVEKTLAEEMMPRRAIVVDAETGSEVGQWNMAELLQQVAAELQEVHGSTAPRSRALKALGLYASDYATSVPSGWRFTTVKPHDTTDTTTTEEKKADA